MYYSLRPEFNIAQLFTGNTLDVAVLIAVVDNVLQTLVFGNLLFVLSVQLIDLVFAVFYVHLSIDKTDYKIACNKK